MNIRFFSLVPVLCVSCATASKPKVEVGPPLAEPLVVENVGFATPECVLYDATADVYLVSNVNGGNPFEKDDNGFVSRLGPDGKLVELKWIDGATEEVTLNSPLGMAITSGTLYVADIDTVRMFDASTGAAKGSIEIAGASLNDVTVGSDGKVYVTDWGMKPGEKGFEPSGTDAVYRIEADNTFTKVAQGDELGRPNGIVPLGPDFLVVTFGSGEMYRLDSNGARHDVLKPPGGMLDRVVVLEDGRVIFSSWGAKSIFEKKADNSFETIAGDLESPADIGFDTKRKRILVPLFMADKVVILQL